MNDNQPTDYNKPVAYDANGQPLFAHPPAGQPAPVVPQPQEHATPQVVQLTRASDPVPVKISEEVKVKHLESKRKYPRLNLSEGEYIISEVRRHPIGLVPPVAVGTFLVLIVGFGLINYPIMQQNSTDTLPPFDSLLLPAFLFIILVALGCYIAIWVYLNNRFFLTNESVVQEIQTTLLAHHEQTVSLANIEDASYRQSGILQMMFNYGSIRLSTEGDETTYRFYYVSDPKKEIATLNNAVEAFKNGRPVESS